MDGGSRQDAAPRDAVGAIGADDDRGFEDPGGGLDTHRVWTWLDATGGDALADVDARGARLACQPGIKLLTADDAQDVRLAGRNDKAHPAKIEMDLGGIDMRDLGHVQAQTLEDDLRIRCQGASAQLVPRVAGLLEEQDARNQLRGVHGQVQRGRETRGSAAEDEDIPIHGAI